MHVRHAYYRLLIAGGLALAMLLILGGAVRLQAAHAAIPAAPAAPDGIVPGTSFVHVALTETISNDFTAITHPQTDLNPEAILLVTPNWNPDGGLSGIYYTHTAGVYYNNSTNHWGVYNEDELPMPENAAFNIYLPPSGTATFVHTSLITNTFSNWTYLDHVLLNGNPDKLVFVTHRFDYGPGTGSRHDQVLGVWYSQGDNQWGIFNQHYTTTMPVSVTFNVHFRNPSLNAFVHRATADNVNANSTYINHPLTNGNPNAILTVAQNWNPGGGGAGTYNNHPIGVWYDPTAQRWAIFNQDLAAMPVNAAFNVLVEGRALFLPLILR